MYTHFYALRERPFSLAPDPRYLFLADSHREALAHLLYGIENGEGFIAITGEVGTGKTTLCRTLLQRIEPGTEVAFIFNPELSAIELLQAIDTELGLETSGLGRRELMDRLNRFLLAKKADGRRVLLLIDEAQNLAPETLEQVRLLSNLETDTAKLIQIVLIGQPELDALLESPDLRQLRQRISVRWRLRSLTSLETRDYVRHRLRIAAGAPREIFTEPALRELHGRSRGIPRLVNLLADRALLAGYAAGARTIGVALVAQADRELGAGARATEGPRAPRRFERPRPRVLARAAAAAALVAAGVGGAVVFQRLAPGGLAAVRGAPLAGMAGEPHSESPEAAGAPARGAPSAAVQAAAAGAPEAVDSSEAGASGVGAAASPAASGTAPSAPARGTLEPAAATAPPEASVAAAAPATLPGVGAAPPPPATASASFSTGADPTAAARAGDDAFPPSFDEALAASSPGAATAESLRALLRLWDAEGEIPAFVSVEDGLARLAEAGIAVLPLRNANQATLALFDHAALLRLRALDGAVRTVLLVELGGEHATLVGLRGAAPLRVPWSEVGSRWTGETYVPWRDFAGLPDVLRAGQRGEAVVWLQSTLEELGFLAEGSRSGVFDRATLEAVREFQRSRQLTPDGDVGPLTKVFLYGALPEHGVPRLTSPAARSAREDVG